VRASIAAQNRAVAAALSRADKEVEDAQPRHEEWMTALPEVKALGFSLDQMQQNRTFQRKEGFGPRGDASAWTDSPADKARKEREKQLGIDGGAGAKRKAGAPAGPSLEDLQKQRAAELVTQYNATVRPKSLMEIHKEQARQGKGGKGKGAAGATPGGWDKAEMAEARPKDKKEIDKMLHDASVRAPRPAPCHPHPTPPHPTPPQPPTPLLSTEGVYSRNMGRGNSREGGGALSGARGADARRAIRRLAIPRHLRRAASETRGRTGAREPHVCPRMYSRKMNTFQI